METQNCKYLWVMPNCFGRNRDRHNRTTTLGAQSFEYADRRCRAHFLNLVNTWAPLSGSQVVLMAHPRVLKKGVTRSCTVIPLKERIIKVGGLASARRKISSST
jgi:hypothetical protein